MEFPPYQSLENEHIREAQEKFGRLERLYHQGQQQAWDGRKVLAGLIAKHGGIHVSDDKRDAILELFSTILWGELAAWSISADLACMLQDTEAKMAATGQAFDEARHFYVMRDYLLALGGRLPTLDGFTRTILRDLLQTRHLVDKLLGMQLIVESVALMLFRAVAEAEVEPVLTDLMPYYERDEARHVGLGVLYLPALLRELGPLDGLRLRALQMKLITFVGWGTHIKRKSFDLLGIDQNAGMHRGMKLQRDIYEQLARAAGRAPDAVLVGSRFVEILNEEAIDIFFPKPGQKLARWHEVLLGACTGIARVADAVLRAAA